MLSHQFFTPLIQNLKYMAVNKMLAPLNSQIFFNLGCHHRRLRSQGIRNKLLAQLHTKSKTHVSRVFTSAFDISYWEDDVFNLMESEEMLLFGKTRTGSALAAEKQSQPPNWLC